ncbi:Solute carrier family 15 member 4 isoform X1 [Oopsacas minuta]|uniref:Solute carrier family 15 member 4 isoform X1 n=1 Tax=Oopsacas minuta TaxID=111878 RepID=A0AAV7K7W3_9METZ|nr:Solute carrier family 15 member 4 isoform X1 [Oopsacas minuta]
MATYHANSSTNEGDSNLEQTFEPLLNYKPPKKKCFQVSGISILYIVLFFHRLTQFSLTWALQLELLTLLKVYENVFSTSTESVFESFIIIGNIISYGLGYLLSPIFGYLADAYFGRYRVILGSLCLLFVSLLSKVIFIGILMHLCPQVVTLQNIFIPSTNQTFGYFSNFTCFQSHSSEIPSHTALGIIAGIAIVSFLVVSSISFSGLFANLCPFFVDQVEGSSEVALSTLFHKYYWVSNLGSVVAAILIPMFQYFSLSISLVISIISNVTTIILFFMYRKRFISQPPHKPYPLSLIKKVVISSFRKRDDDLDDLDDRTVLRRRPMLCHPTGVLDRAKVSNGGRFQVETVEDSKAFFRLLAVFLSFMGLYYIQIQALGIFSLQAFYLDLPNPASIYQKVLTYSIVSNSLQIFDSFAVLIAQPILMLTLRKLGPWAPNLLQRMGIGYVLGLLGIVMAALVDVLRVEFPCMINLFIQIPQYTLIGLSESIGIVSHMEFTYAQSPYTMKGMLFGFMQCSRGIGIYILTALVLLVSLASNCGNGDISDIVDYIDCNRVDNTTCLYYSVGLSPKARYFWLMNLLIALVGLPIFSYIAYRYSQRRRHYTD